MRGISAGSLQTDSRSAVYMSEAEAEECECPLCGEYSGPPSSVEAHISRKTDGAHKGEVGQLHRAELHGEQAAVDGDDVDGEEVEDDEGDSGGDDSSEEGEQSGDSVADSVGDEGARPVVEEGERADVEEILQGGVDGDESDDEEPPSGGGIEAVEEATEMAQADGLDGLAFVIATISLVAVVLLGARSGSTSEQPEESSDDGGDDEQDDGDDMPLWGE